jgi:hypothetical protein
MFSLLGSINILFRLTLFGTYIVSHYQLFDDSYEFKNNLNEDFQIKKVGIESSEKKDTDESEKKNLFSINKCTVFALVQNKNESNDECQNN